VGFYPVREPDASFTLTEDYTCVGAGSSKAPRRAISEDSASRRQCVPVTRTPLMKLYRSSLDRRMSPSAISLAKVLGRRKIAEYQIDARINSSAMRPVRAPEPD
jgi:hypothetical protein